MLDEIRANSIGFAAIPIQKLVRGHLGRLIYWGLVGNKKKELEVLKKLEVKENSFMALEDALSREFEDIYRSFTYPINVVLMLSLIMCLRYCVYV